MKKLLLFAAAVAFLAFLPDNEPSTPAELGEVLFHDPILSSDQTVSCGTCHVPRFAFADTSAVSKGVGGQLGTRNTPGITNMGARSFFFWDGRAPSLEHQVVGPIENPVEMNLPLPIALERLRTDARYTQYFKKIFGKPADTTNLALALSEFIRTLETGATPFDRWMQGDKTAMNTSAIRGRKIFLEKGKCFDCHFGPDFTGDEFRNIGLYNGKSLNDTGRYGVTQKEEDKGKFKVPGLRNVAMTAPYMHNGQFQTLKEVIDYYDRPDHFGLASIGRDTLLQRPLQLTEQEKEDLEAFLHALTDDRYK